MLQGPKGQRFTLELRPHLLVNDPQALCQSALMGLGMALLAIPDVLSHLESGALKRVLPIGTSMQGKSHCISRARSCCRPRLAPFLTRWLTMRASNSGTEALMPDSDVC